jgi:hypothetical protein
VAATAIAASLDGDRRRAAGGGEAGAGGGGDRQAAAGEVDVAPVLVARVTAAPVVVLRVFVAPLKLTVPPVLLATLMPAAGPLAVRLPETP